MNDILLLASQLLPLGPGALGLSLATALVLGLRGIFKVAKKLAQKTPSNADDQIIDAAKEAFREKSKDI